jgi:hypothetical protein
LAERTHAVDKSRHARRGYAHAQPTDHARPTDDSLRIYAVDIWQDPPQSWGPGRGVYLGKGLVITAAHVVTPVARTKPRVHTAGMELPATAIPKARRALTLCCRRCFPLSSKRDFPR